MTAKHWKTCLSAEAKHPIWIGRCPRREPSALVHPSTPRRTTAWLAEAHGKLEMFLESTQKFCKSVGGGATLLYRGPNMNYSYHFTKTLKVCSVLSTREV